MFKRLAFVEAGVSRSLRWNSSGESLARPTLWNLALALLAGTAAALSPLSTLRMIPSAACGLLVAIAAFLARSALRPQAALPTLSPQLWLVVGVLAVVFAPTGGWLV